MRIQFILVFQAEMWRQEMPSVERFIVGRRQIERLNLRLCSD